MHLFTYEDFGTRFGIDTTEPDFRDAIVKSSRAATQYLASHLRFTDFNSYTGRKDFFQVERPYGTTTGGWYHFRLSRGFTSKAQLTRVVSVTSPIQFRNNETDTQIDLTDVANDGASDHVYLNGVRGKLSVHDVSLVDRWVCVEYSGGLDVATDDNFEGVPDWLREVAMAQAAMFLQRHKAFTPEEGGGDLSELKGLVSSAFSHQGRFLPDAMDPTFSE